MGVSFDAVLQSWAEQGSFQFGLWSDTNKGLALHYGAASSPNAWVADRIMCLGSQRRGALDLHGQCVGRTHPKRSSTTVGSSLESSLVALPAGSKPGSVSETDVLALAGFVALDWVALFVKISIVGVGVCIFVVAVVRVVDESQPSPPLAGLGGGLVCGSEFLATEITFAEIP